MAVDPSYIAPNAYVDADHPSVVAFAGRHAGDADTPREVAVALYYAVRDGFRYNPWRVRVEPQAYTASGVIERNPEEGAHCIDKALVLAAVCRARGIPARLHFADVRNHIGTGALEARLGTDLLVFHGYCELYLEARWVAATPAFNVALCERLGVAPLEFDGVNDSILQAYDREKGKFMEYVEDHGVFADIPFDRMIAAWRQHYPTLRDHGVWPER